MDDSRIMPYQAPLTFSQQQLTIGELKSQLEQFSEYQKDAFLQHQPVADLVYGRAEYIDMLLNRLWDSFGFNQHPYLSLVAVGGYGRSELHPLSDIDILVVSRNRLSDAVAAKISEFITLLWDLRLEVGHAVRTVKECAELVVTI